MKEINFEDADWLLIRQALSLGLLGNEEVLIRSGAGFLDRNPEYVPLFEDLTRTASHVRAGRIGRRDTSIILEPQNVMPGAYTLESTPSSSAVDILLFLMPALFQNRTRSVLNLAGVTHSALSYPTGFIKNCFLEALEQLGFFASLMLKRFGFQGTGGGSLESRIYPREEPCGKPFQEGTSELAGATIYLSHLDMELALEEKRIIAELTGLRQDGIAIIDVQDSDGYGNSIQVCIDFGGIHLILFREARIFNERGDFTFDREAARTMASDLSREVNALLLGHVIPVHIVRELYPYFILSGTKMSHENENAMVLKTAKLCDLILG
jgi:RNA 3'-terminal phosphate cyclase